MRDRWYGFVLSVPRCLCGESTFLNANLRVGPRVPAFAGAAMDHAVALQHGAGGNLRHLPQLLVIGREIGPRRLEQLLETFDDEIALLESINAIAGVHDAQQI